MEVILGALVVFNIYLAYELYSFRKRLLRETAYLVTKQLKGQTSLLAQTLNKDMNDAVNEMEGRIVEYMRHYTDITPPPGK